MKLPFILLIFALLSLAALFSTCGQDNEPEVLSKEIVERIPKGSSKEDVRKFIKERGFQFDIQSAPLGSPKGVDFEWWVAWAERNSLTKGRYLLEIHFFFDKEDGQLADFEVRRSYKAL